MTSRSVRTHNVTTTFAYDDAGGLKNLLATSDSTGRSMTYVRDARGNARSSSTDGTASAFFDFDSNNRLMRSSDALGNETTFSYEHSSCGCGARDPRHRNYTPDLPRRCGWAFAYGPNGRLTKVGPIRTGSPETMTYLVTRGRDGEGPPPGRSTSSMTYDQLGRLTALIDIADRAHAYRTRSRRPARGRVLPECGQRFERRAKHEPTAAPQDGDYQIGLNAFDVEGYPARIALYRDATFGASATRVRSTSRAADEPLRPGEPRDHVDVVLERRRGRHVRRPLRRLRHANVGSARALDDEHDLGERSRR